MSLWNSTAGWKTQQIPSKFEAALGRHSQAVRWIQSIVCPCLQQNTQQADPTCQYCQGRGWRRKLATNLKIFQEPHTCYTRGKVKLDHTPYIGTPTVWHQGKKIAISATQPADNSYIQFDYPYPDLYNVLYIDYEFSPEVSITSENSSVIGTNTLQTIATQATSQGANYAGSINTVTRVYNSTRSESYIVSSTSNDFIFLSGMGSWQSGDVLKVDYTYVPPYKFVISGVSPKMSWDSPYITESSDAILLVPSFVKVSTGDLFTMMVGEELGSEVVNPNTTTGNDELRTYFDIKSITSITLKDNTLVDDTTYQLFGRNQIKWISAKPTQNFTVQFFYNPTFAALPSKPNMRFAENKRFVSRVPLRLYTRTSSQEVLA